MFLSGRDAPVLFPDIYPRVQKRVGMILISLLYSAGGANAVLESARVLPL